MSDLLKAYEILRAEIIENSRTVVTLFVANTTVTAVIVGYGLSDKNSAGGQVFFAPLLILIPSLFFIASQLESTTTISQYLRVVLEPQLELRWQTDWYNLRQENLLPKRRKYISAVSGLYGALCFICLGLAYITWREQMWIYWTAAGVSALPLFLAVRAIQQAFSNKFRDDMARAWQNLIKLSTYVPPGSGQNRIITPPQTGEAARLEVRQTSDSDRSRDAS